MRCLLISKILLKCRYRIKHESGDLKFTKAMNPRRIFLKESLIYVDTVILAVSTFFIWIKTLSYKLNLLFQR